MRKRRSVTRGRSATSHPGTQMVYMYKSGVLSEINDNGSIGWGIGHRTDADIDTASRSDMHHPIGFMDMTKQMEPDLTLIDGHRQ